MPIEHVNELQNILRDKQLGEARELVRKGLTQIAAEAYKRDETFRLLTYSQIIIDVSNMIIDDGGPAVALRFLKDACTAARKEADDRGRTAVGPFLSEAARADLADDYAYQASRPRLP
jgi:hypothetical protein